MLCPLCQGEIKDTANFCIFCGKRIPRCPTCGNILRKRARFCSKDGTAIPDEILALFPEVSPLNSELDLGATPVRRETAAQPSPAAPKRFCIRCGKPCAPDQRLCDSCRQKEAPATKAKKSPAKWLIILLIILSVVALAAAGWLIWNKVSGGIELFPNKSTASSDIDREENKDRYSDEEQDEDDDDFAAEETPAETTEAVTEPVTEAVTEPATEASTEMPTEAPVITYASEYELIVADVSWQEAQLDCEIRGGTLAAITSQEEFDQICRLLEDSELTYI